MAKPRLTGLVCSRKHTNMSSTPSLVTQRKKVVKRQAKTKMKCKGGLLNGESLYLSTAGTMPFSIGGIKGFYNHLMNWVEL